MDACECRQRSTRDIVLDIERSVRATHADVNELKSQIQDLREGVVKLGDLVNAAAADIVADIQAVADGWAAKDALIEQLRSQLAVASEALAAAGEHEAAAVAAQSESDDVADAGVISAADVALENLLNPPAPVEPPVV